MIKQLTILIFFVSLSSYGQTSFKQEIDNVYNFYPHKISKSEQEEKFPVLDKFFELIKSDTSKYLPLLRLELKSNNHLPYFYYDCSHLLMILSKSRSDKELSAEAFAKCNIKDLDPKVYVILLKSLANSHIDITKAAMKILENSNFHFLIPEHAMDFSQGYCLMYCLLPLDPNIYSESLIQYFLQTKDIVAQKSIITTLWFSYSCSGDKFLQSLSQSGENKEVLVYAKQLLSDTKLDKDYKKLLKTINASELDEMKKSALKRFSDEAIYDLDFVTKASRQKLSCR